MKINLQVNIEWNSHEGEAISPEHEEALRESGIERVATMVAQGYTSGELHDNIILHDTDPEDGVGYSGWWSIKTKDSQLVIPEGCELVPKDLVTHINAWRGACEEALDNLSTDPEENLETPESWRNTIDLLNKIEWDISRFDVDQELAPKGWCLAPKSLADQLSAIENALQIAESNAAGRDPDTHVDDKAYWSRELRVLGRIKDLLEADKESEVSLWTSVADSLPPIPANHIRAERPFLVKTSKGEVLPAHLFGAKPLFKWDGWNVGAEGRKERHWVALEGGGSDMDRILSDVVAWRPMPQ